MTEHTSAPLVALVEESSAGVPDSVVADLASLGWRTRVLRYGAVDADTEGADLLVAEVAQSVLDPLAPLHAFTHLPYRAPLLVVASSEQLGYWTHELIVYLHGWPCPTDVIVRPYSRIELHIRAAWLLPPAIRMPFPTEE